MSHPDPRFVSINNEPGKEGGPDYITKSTWAQEFVLTTENIDSPFRAKFVTLNKGKKGPLHFHTDKDEMYFVIEGNMMFVWIDTRNGNEKHMVVGAGESVYAPKALIHQIGGSTDCKRIYVSEGVYCSKMHTVRPGSTDTM